MLASALSLIARLTPLPGQASAEGSLDRARAAADEAGCQATCSGRDGCQMAAIKRADPFSAAPRGDYLSWEVRLASDSLALHWC